MTARIEEGSVIQQAAGMIPLPELAREAYLSNRQLRHWIAIGLIRAVRLDHSQGRHYWYIREEDRNWVLQLAELVRLGFSVEMLAASAQAGRLERCIADMADATAMAAHRVPQWLRRETA